MNADAVVVGAGASGLACARALADEGARVVVLEARDRVGGRIHTLRLRGEEPVELGAHVVHGAEACTWDVLRRAGIETTRLPAGGVVVAAAGRTYDAAELVAAGVVPPWLVEGLLVRADVPDASVGDVLAGAGLRGLELALAREWLVQVWGGEPDELSAAGVRRAKAASTAGEGEFAVTEGYDAVVAHLARGLDVRLGSAARLVARRPAGVEVGLAGGGSVRAAAAVVTIPPPVVVAGRLHFDPPLPRAKALAARAIRLCDALTVVARLDRPASGTAWGLAVGETSGFWRAREGSRVVLGVLKGASAGRLRRGGVDAGVASGLLSAVFPWLRQAAVEDVSVADWGTDPLALGAFSYPRVGALDAPSAWAEPVEASIFFAGEATCRRRHAGTVHGAIESGVRSAGEVLAALDSAAPNRGVDPEDEPSAAAVAGRGGRDGKRGGRWP